jgi:23S rRNA (pseudouridine1915-N3)-methyltransferase
MRLRLVMLGKTRRAELRALLADYVARLGRYAAVEVTELAESPAALRRLRVEPGARWVLLDAAGKQHTSQSFARWLAAERERGTRELVFLCGGAEGYPEELRRRVDVKLSLAPLTMPHELARVVLAEQLYRAFTILAGHPYPR